MVAVVNDRSLGNGARGQEPGITRKLIVVGQQNFLSLDHWLIVVHAVAISRHWSADRFFYLFPRSAI